MDKTVFIAAAGNTLAPALAALQALGYVVSVVNDSILRAESAEAVFLAEDPLQLLGLIKMHEVRGNNWQPSDAEVDAWLAFDTQ